MGYDPKKTKVWSKACTEHDLVQTVRELFEELSRCTTGEVWIRRWPTISSEFEGGYIISMRMAADGWLDPDYTPPLQLEQFSLFGFAQPKPPHPDEGGDDLFEFPDHHKEPPEEKEK